MIDAMNRKVAVVWLIAAVGSLTACVDERSFTIVQNQVPEEGCMIPGVEGDVYRPAGVLDVQGRMGYRLFPLVRNDLPSSVAVDGQPERNTLYMRRFEVELELGDADPGGVPAELTTFDVPTSASLAPVQTRSSAVKIIKEELLDMLQVSKDFRPTVLAKVQAVAEHAGTDIKSTTLVYPVEICDGCLVTVLSACPGPDDEVDIPANPCGLAQDQAVACCNDPARGFVCLSGGSS